MFIRWHVAGNYWEYDTSALQTGAGPWLALPKIPYLHANNIFTVVQEINYANPSLQIFDSSRPVNSRRFQIINTSNFLYLQAVSDAIDASHGYVRIARDGSIYNTSSITAATSIYERSRTVAMGEWQAFTPAFKGHGSDGAVGNGSMNAKYTLIGKTVFYQIRMLTGSTTVFPTGAYWGFSLPPGYGIEGSRISLGSGFIYAVDGRTFILAAINGGFLSVPLTNCAAILVSTGASHPYAPPMQAGIPFAWGANNWIAIDGNYEIP